jgi:hypothetical protein
MQMKFFILFVLTMALLINTFGQNSFPALDGGSLASPNVDLKQIDKPYTIVVYGAVGCGWSKLLINHLNVLDDCRSKADIILIMDQPKDSLVRHMDKIIENYPTFSNVTLGYQLKKKTDIFPQVLLFKNEKQVDHIIGVKKDMLSKIKSRVLKTE